MIQRVDFLAFIIFSQQQRITTEQYLCRFLLLERIDPAGIQSVHSSSVKEIQLHDLIYVKVLF